MMIGVWVQNPLKDQVSLRDLVHLFHWFPARVEDGDRHYFRFWGLGCGGALSADP